MGKRKPDEPNAHTTQTPGPNLHSTCTHIRSIGLRKEGQHPAKQGRPASKELLICMNPAKDAPTKEGEVLETPSHNHTQPASTPPEGYNSLKDAEVGGQGLLTPDFTDSSEAP